MGPLSGLVTVAPVALERWFATRGAPTGIDLARSGAPDLNAGEILAAAGDEAVDAYLDLPLGYGDPLGEHRLRAAIVAAGHAQAVEEVIVTAGAAEALLLAMAAAFDDSTDVAVGVPAYGGLVRAAEAAGGRVRTARVWHQNDRTLDLAGLRRAVDSGVAHVVVNSPHNPTGAVADAGELAALVDACARRRGRVIVDEVAVGTLDAGARGVASRDSFASGTVVAVGDVSKSLGLGGLRIGWLTCADAAFRARVATLKDVTTIAPAIPSQFLAALALDQAPALSARVAAVAGRNRDRLAGWVSATPGVEWSPPVDGLVAFPRVAGVDDLTGLARRLRTDRGTSVVPGSLFDTPAHFRVGFGVDPSMFSRGLEMIGRALGEVEAR